MRTYAKHGHASMVCEAPRTTITRVRRRGIVLAGLAVGVMGARRSLAQRVHRVSAFFNGTERTLGRRYEAFRAGMAQLGYVENKNLTLKVRWNEGGLQQLAELASETLQDKPDVVFCGPVLAAAAIRKLNPDMPIVMGYGAGAIKIGLAKSHARPGGSVTGLESQNEELTPKHMELLKEIAPSVTRLGVVNTGNFLYHEEAWQAANRAARILKLSLIDIRVDAAGQLERIGALCGKGGCDGLYVMPDPVTINWRRQIIDHAAQLRLPAVYFQPEFAQEGGLISYSPNIEDMFRRAATFVDKILKGTKPADLPIERPTRFELIVNGRTAKALGITIPQTILVRADRIIE